jgi:hypothetical protein
MEIIELGDGRFSDNTNRSQRNSTGLLPSVTPRYKIVDTNIGNVETRYHLA